MISHPQLLRLLSDAARDKPMAQGTQDWLQQAALAWMHGRETFDGALGIASGRGQARPQDAVRRSIRDSALQDASFDLHDLKTRQQATEIRQRWLRLDAGFDPRDACDLAIERARLTHQGEPLSEVRIRAVVFGY